MPIQTRPENFNDTHTRNYEGLMIDNNVDVVDGGAGELQGRGGGGDGEQEHAFSLIVIRFRFDAKIKLNYLGGKLVASVVFIIIIMQKKSLKSTL